MAKNNLTLISRILNYLLLFFAICLTYSYCQIKELPKSSDIIPSTLEEPIQTNLTLSPFKFSYEDSDYQLIPHAEYKINGLVVTHNNVKGIGDAYHTSKSVDLKDLCLLWGENVVTPFLKDIKFWSEPWTCVFQSKNQEAFSSFRLDQISNNHLLAANESVKKTIEKIKVGDQIEMQGLLVDYYPHGASEALRKTSLIREDTGNGACEVLYVESIDITSEWRPAMSKLYRTSKLMLLSLVIIRILSFFILPWLEYKYT